MAKVRKGITVVLRLDELNLWMRKQNLNNTKVISNDDNKKT